MSVQYPEYKTDSNQLIKYICFRYASAKCPAQVPGVLRAWSLATDHCITQSAFTFTVLKGDITEDLIELDDVVTNLVTTVEFY